MTNGGNAAGQKFGIFFQTSDTGHKKAGAEQTKVNFYLLAGNINVTFSWGERNGNRACEENFKAGRIEIGVVIFYIITRTMKLQIIIEKNDGMLWGRVEGKGNYMPTPYGKTKDAVIKNLRDLIGDYQLHEGKTDKFWSKLDVNKMEIEIQYDLEAFFEEHDYLSISSVAKRAGINASLMRQYATGIKHPSSDQAKRIEDTIHSLAKELKSVSLYAA